MRMRTVGAAILLVVSLVGCGAPEAKPPVGAESSDTKLDIEEGNGDAKPAGDAPAAGEAAKP